ncbi:MAG: hypothetical protein ACRCXT_06180 [Paraclostridium sp.]
MEMNNRVIDQFSFIRQYNETHRKEFNDELFNRSELDIIAEVQNVILSCQRDQNYKIIVKDFTIIDTYDDIINIMYEYEESLKSKGNKRKKVDNPYEFINLKDSDVIILKVTYQISAKDGDDELEVLILIPKIVDKYYFRINGNYYFAMYQIVDASTYNNSTSTNAKSPSVTLKTLSRPIRLYRNITEVYTYDKSELVKMVYYNMNAFSKTFNTFKYILAKYGLYGAINMTGLHTIYFSDKEPEVENPEMYTFMKNNIYISVPKMIYHGDYTTQSFIHAILCGILKDTSFNDIFLPEYWLKILGQKFSGFNIDKGISILKSIESTYDITTKSDIHLPEEYKSDIYHILRWCVREFNNLRNKDNLDISTKKIRYAEYIASLYAMKLYSGIYRLSDTSTSLNDIKKSINIKPSLLIENITRCNLVNYRNLSNDLDSLIATKFTYKGISGMGEKNARNVPVGIKYTHPSNQGRIDMDTSPKSAPGMSGVLCPSVKLYDGGFFSEFEEPNTWDEEFAKLMEKYQKTKGLKQIYRAQEVLLNESVDKQQEQYVDENIRTIQRLFIPVNEVINDMAQPNIVNLEPGGVIYAEY